jgi:cell division protein ZapE
MTRVRQRYDALVTAGELRPDPEQRAAADRLDRLQHELETAANGGLFGRLLGRKSPAPRGIY